MTRTIFRPTVRRLAAPALTLALFALLAPAAHAAAPTAAAALDGAAPAMTALPTVDVNQAAGTVARRLPTAAQLAAIDSFRQAHPGATVRWDDFGGSPDVVYGFAATTSAADPVNAALGFLLENPDLFGVTGAASLAVDAAHTKTALGGHLVRFDQLYQGIRVAGAGYGLVLDRDNRVRAVSGPFFRDLAVDTSPALGAGAAVAAATADLAPFARGLDAASLATLEPAYELIEAQLGVLATPHPELAVYPTADGARLAWKLYQYSRDPFGLYLYMIDAHSGAVLFRESMVRTADDEPAAAPGTFTADYFPTSPPITGALQDEAQILDDDGLTVGRPTGQIRIEVRKIDPTNAATGVEGTISGTHALINSALPSKAPFAQAAAGTFHFAQDNPPLEGRTTEDDQLAEPAEHQDGISQFIYITSLIEYLDYLHRAGDAVHSRGVGEGDFPDSYPNDQVPLTGTVHIPNVASDVCGDPGEPTDADFPRHLLACDNAFAVPVSDTVAGQEVVVNPTFYGHGWLFNDLALDFAVPLHEGTHATITPIAGLEGSPEGGALNEGQADLWAYTIGENTSLGAYIVNAPRLRQLLRDAGIDPDTYRWIRNADSQIRYSQIGSRDNVYEVHRDGEIYAGAMWDLRQLMLAFETAGGFARPNAITGEPTDPASLGKETWERIFLGSMYVLGTMSPDTFVRARDAMLIADAVLYPADPLDLASPGRHHALIERAFAAREMGLNAEAPVGGRQTISTAVDAFTAAVPAPAAPQNVVARPVSADAVGISWDAVPGAVAYEVLARRAGDPAKRLYPGVPGRPYYDGDVPEQLSGFTHLEWVIGATSYRDAGQAVGRTGNEGLDSLDYQYAVRALRVNPDHQVGASDLSGTAPVALSVVDVTPTTDAALTEVSFAGGVFSFDQTLTNRADGTLYTPISFEILSISQRSVTVVNADNGGSGQNGDQARFAYQPSLAAGETSAPRHLVFDDPQGKLFTFDARITARVEATATPATGSQPPDGAIDAAPKPAPNPRFVEQYTGIVPIGSAGNLLAQGVDYVDVAFHTQPSAVSVTGTLSATPSVPGAYPDLDFELRDAAGHVLDDSGNLGPGEEVSYPVQPDTTYVYRVIGFANGPTTFQIVSDQEVTDPADAGDATSGGVTSGTASELVRFTVNPRTGTVTRSILDLD